MWTLRCSEWYNKTASEDNGRKKTSMKTVTEDQAASHDDEVGPSDVASIGDITTFMKLPFTETDVLEEN